MRSRSGLPILMLNFSRPTREKSNLRGSKNIAFEQAISSLHGRRIARPHLAIDLEQRVDRLGDDVFLQASETDTGPTSSRSGKNTEKLRNSGFDNLLKFRRRDLVVRFENDLAALGVDDVGDSESTFELR